MTGRRDLTGQRFGKLVALECVGNDKHGKALWCFQCDCGNRKVLPGEKVRRKIDPIRSCGCIRASYKTGEDALLNQIYMSIYNDGDLTFEDFKELSQQDCYYCGAKPSNVSRRRKGRGGKKYNNQNEFNRQAIYQGLDRIDQTKPHDKTNVLPCCYRCNEKKNTDSRDEFMRWIETIYQRHYTSEIGNVLTLSK